MKLEAFRKIAIIVFIIILVLVAVLGIYFFVIKKPSNNNDNDQKVTLNWWGLWEEDATMQTLIAKYNETNPNVEIVYAKKDFHTFPDGLQSIKESIKQRLSDQDPVAPDIVTINNSWLPELQAQLSPMPLSIYTQAEYENTFYPHALQDCTGSNAQLYCIPTEFEGLALYYNKELLSDKGITEPASSWEELIDQAKSLTQRDTSGKITVSGLAFGGGEKVTHSADIITLLLLQRKQAVTAKSSGSSLYTVSLEDSVGQEVFDFYTNGVTSARLWDDTLPTDKQLFIDGKLAMIFAPSWYTFDIKKYNPDLNFDIAEVPQVSNLSNERVDFADYWAWAVSGTSPNQSVAWDFLKFLSQPEQYELMHNTAIAQKTERVFGRIYPRKDMADKLSSVPYVKPFIEMAPTAKTVFVGNRESYNELIQTQIDAVTSSNRSQSSNSAYSNFKDGLESILSESQ